MHVIDAVLLPPVYPEYVFNVDMNEAGLVGGDRVFIAGSFGRDINWVEPGNNSDLEMFDLDGDGIYSITLNLQNGEIAFKFFKNIGWNGGEWKYNLAGSETLNFKWGIPGLYINVKSNNINVSIYPNPVVDMLNVSLELPNAKLAIYNSLGVMIEKVTIQGTQARIDVSGYTHGLYFLKVNNDTVARFVK